jgi:hypothetical protein
LTFHAFRHSPLVLVVSLSMLLIGAVPVGAAEPADAILPSAVPIEGIDVSHHQNEINWGRVRRDGKVFAFIKVTEGHRYIDPLYAYNHRLARAAGLRVGAYHFAQPTADLADAVRQADHFLAWFNLDDGDLVPVLDLEEANGLDAATLTEWALLWLTRVRGRTGLSPVIYASPVFWRNHVEDTTAIAAAGHILWIADWDSDAPRTPAADRGRGRLVGLAVRRMWEGARDPGLRAARLPGRPARAIRLPRPRLPARRRQLCSTRHDHPPGRLSGRIRPRTGQPDDPPPTPQGRPTRLARNNVLSRWDHGPESADRLWLPRPIEHLGVRVLVLIGHPLG